MRLGRKVDDYIRAGGQFLDHRCVPDVAVAEAKIGVVPQRLGEIFQ
jgi:hypothetical protein